MLWFLATHPGAIVITTATSYRQVVGILWREITTFLGKAQKAGFGVRTLVDTSRMINAVTWAVVLGSIMTAGTAARCSSSAPSSKRTCG